LIVIEERGRRKDKPLSLLVFCVLREIIFQVETAIAKNNKGIKRRSDPVKSRIFVIGLAALTSPSRQAPTDSYGQGKKILGNVPPLAPLYVDRDRDIRIFKSAYYHIRQSGRKPRKVFPFGLVRSQTSLNAVLNLDFQAILLAILSDCGRDRP